MKFSTLILCQFFAGALFAQASLVAGARPNIIFIVADDHGYADFSAYPHHAKDAQTPNLDRLARSGVLFSNAYAPAAICSPSRVGMLTGRYQQRWGVHNFKSSKLVEGETTLPALLKQQGYVTGKVGKTHYGDNSKPGGHDFPLNHGYDEFYGFTHHTKHYLKHTAAEAKLHRGGLIDAGPMYVGRKKEDQQGYSTDLFERAAQDFIRRHQQKKFYLKLSFNAVHLFTNQLPEADLKKAGIPPGEDWDPVKEPGNSGYMKWYFRNLKKHGDDPTPFDPHGRERYLLCLKHMDESIGRILDLLKELKIDNNTMIVYISDNGGDPRTYASNKPLRDYKYSLHEGGIRVPFIMCWPGKIKAGAAFDAPVTGRDVFPTLAKLAGCDMSGIPARDGMDILPYVQDPKSKPPVRNLFWTLDYSGVKSFAVRSGSYKYIVDSKKGESLYDLDHDISEQNNLAATKPAEVARLKQAGFEWLEEMNCPDFQLWQ